MKAPAVFPLIPVCPGCGRSDTQRIARVLHSNKQRWLARLGWYPWECWSCQTTFFAHQRNVRRTSAQ